MNEYFQCVSLINDNYALDLQVFFFHHVRFFFLFRIDCVALHLRIVTSARLLHKMMAKIEGTSFYWLDGCFFNRLTIVYTYRAHFSNDSQWNEKHLFILITSWMHSIVSDLIFTIAVPFSMFQFCSSLFSFNFFYLAYWLAHQATTWSLWFRTNERRSTEPKQTKPNRTKP